MISFISVSGFATYLFLATAYSCSVKVKTHKVYKFPVDMAILSQKEGMHVFDQSFQHMYCILQYHRGNFLSLATYIAMIVFLTNMYLLKYGSDSNRYFRLKIL